MEPKAIQPATSDQHRIVTTDSAIECTALPEYLARVSPVGHRFGSVCGVTNGIAIIWLSMFSDRLPPTSSAVCPPRKMLPSLVRAGLLGLYCNGESRDDLSGFTDRCR